MKNGGAHMFNKIILGLIFSLALNLSAFADNDPYKLAEEYGPTFKGAPFALKYKFEKEYGKPWSSTTEDERKGFLTTYHENLQKDLTEENTQKQEEQELLRQKKEEKAEKIRAYQEKINDRKRKELDELRAENEKKRDMNSLREDKKRALRELRQGQTSTR
jgi:hypothetical protein